MYIYIVQLGSGAGWLHKGPIFTLYFLHTIYEHINATAGLRMMFTLLIQKGEGVRGVIKKFVDCLYKIKTP